MVVSLHLVSPLINLLSNYFTQFFRT